MTSLTSVLFSPPKKRSRKPGIFASAGYAALRANKPAANRNDTCLALPGVIRRITGTVETGRNGTESVLSCIRYPVEISLNSPTLPVTITHVPDKIITIQKEHHPVHHNIDEFGRK
jgi:hypothetical protein